MDQSAAGQNKIADASTLTINNATVNLQGTGGGTETVAGVVLGRGLNVINRSAGTGILQANAITFGTGAALNVGNIGTAAGSSWLTTDNLNNNLILGGRMVSINGTTDTNWVKNATNAADGAVIAASGADYTTNNAPDTWTTATQNILMTATGTAVSTASRTINSLKIAHATATTAVTVDIGAGNTLTLNDGFNGGGIIRNQNGATTIGGATVGVGSLTAGGVDDSVNDTLYIWNSQNTLNIFNVIKDNNTGVGTDKLHLFSGGVDTTTVHAANTFTGGTTIAAGTVAIGANSAGSNDASLGSGDIVNHGTLVLSKQTTATLAQQTIANNITGTGALTINRGTATLSGVNDFSGLTTVSASTTLRAGSATGISANSRMLLNAASAVLNLNTFDVSVAALRGDQNTADVQLGSNTLTLSGSNLTASSTAETLQFVAQNYQGIISGTGNLIKNGPYTQVFTAGGALTYTGTTTVNGGLLQFNKASATTGVTVNNAATFIANASSATGATAAVSLAGVTSTFQVNNGFNQSIGSLSGVTNSRLLISRGATATNVTVTDNGGAPVAFAGVIQETGTGANGGSFTKAGTNTLILTGGNNYSGATTINGGILQTGASNLVQVIPDRSAVVLADAASTSLDLNGVNETIGSLAGGGSTGGNVTLGAAQLTVGMNGTSTSFGGVISGTGGLSKVGNGTLTLTGNNIFTGSVSILSGGLTLGAASPNTLASGSNVALVGKGATLTVNTNQTLGALVSGKISVLALGTGATLSSGTAASTVTTTTVNAIAVGANVATFTAAHGLTEGMLLTGTNIPAGTFVRRVISSTSIELSQHIGTAVTASTSITGTGTNLIASQFTGAGGYTKEGTGTVWLSPFSPYSESNNTGATTVNAGTLLLGGEGSYANILSRNSALVVNTGGTVNFFGPNANLRNYQEVGSLAGTGGTINLRPNNTGAAALVVGRDNTNTTWGGVFIGDTTEAAVMKTGTGTLTLTGLHTSDNIYRAEQGGLTVSGAGRLDDASLVVLSNRTGATLSYSIGANTDSIRNLVGGGRVVGFQPYTIGGTAFSANFGGNMTNQTGGEVSVASTSVLRVSSNDSPRVFGGVLSGAGTFQKSGTGLMDLWGANTIDNILVDGGILRLGAFGVATGLGDLASSGFGSLSDTSVLTVNNGGTFDLNGATETIGRIATGTATSTIALINGSLTTSAQTSLTTATSITGNLNSSLNIGASSAATLTFNGNSSAFGGTINVGTNAAIANATGGNLGDTSRINLNSTGTQFTVAIADTIGSLAGTGNTNLTATLTLQEARSGTVSAAPYSGVFSGAGGLTLSNYGGLTLSGTHTNSGATTLSSGSLLNLSYGAGSDILGTGALTLNGGRLAIFSTSAAPPILESVASTTLNAGASSIESWSNHTANSALAQGNGMAGINLGVITRNTGGTLNVASNSAASSITGGALLGGWAVVNGASWAVGNGTTAAITPLTTFSADVFGAGLNVDITAAGANAGGLADTLRFSGANAADITGVTTIATGGILVTRSVGANTSTISGALNATGNELIIHQYNPLGDLILSNVAGTNTAITTAGGGKTVISSSIGGTGGTNVGNGYLQLGTGGTTGIVGSGNILNNGTIGINRSNAVGFAAAIISGTGNLEQIGSGTTTLGATNTYTGRTTVRGGTLEVTNNAGLGAGVTGVNRTANLTSVNTGGTLSFTGGVTAISELLNLDGGTLNIATTAASTYSAPVVLSSSSTITLGTGAAVTHILSGQVIGLPGQNLTINGVASGSTLAFTNASNVINGNLTIGSNAIVKVGNNSAGTLGVTGSISNSGTLAFDSNDAHQFVNNTISGAGNIEVRRSTVWLTGNLSGATGNLIIPTTNANVQVFLGDHDYTPAAPGFANISVTGNAGGSSGARFSQANNLLTLNSNITLQPVNDTAGTNNRLTYFIKNNVGTLELTGKIAGEYAATSTDDRSYLEVNGGGLLRVVTNAASNNFMMGLTGGVADTAKAYGGQIALQGDTSTGRTSSNWGYFEITGDANQTISANITGGGNGDQGGIFIYNGSGTLTLSPAAGTGAGDGNTLFNSRNQINRGTVIFNSAVTGGAWRNDGFISVGSGATLQVNAAETTNIGLMKNGTLNLNGANYTQNGNSAFFAAGQVTGTGALILNGNVTNRLNNVNNTFSGGLTLNRGQAQFTDSGSLGTGTITIASGASTEAETQLLQYVGINPSVETVSNAVNITGSDAARQKGFGAYGVGQLVVAGTVTVASPNLFNLRGTSTGTHALMAPFSSWSIGVPTVSGQITGAGGLLKEDGGAWALTNATNNFTGNINHNNGRLIAYSIGALGGTTKTYNLGSATGTPTLEFSSAFTGGTLASTVEMNLSGTTGTVRIVNLGSGALTIADPTWTATGGGAKTLALGRFDDNAALTNIISGVIVDNSGTNTTALTKDGLSTWRLDGVSTFTGAVTVNEGTLILNNAAGTAISNSADVNVNNAFGRGATLQLNFNETIDHLSGNLGATVSLGANTLTIGANNGAATYNGLISGTGGIIKTGTGAIGLGGQSNNLPTLGQNTYTGVTSITNGRIDTATLANGGVPSGIGQSTSAAANLVLAGTADNAGLRFIGTRAQSTDRLFQLGPISTGSSRTAIWADGAFNEGINEASIEFSNTGAIGFTGTGARTLTLRGGAVVENIFRPLIGDNGAEVTSFQKLENSIWTLTNANTFTGAVTVNGGTLAITNNASLGTSAGGVTITQPANDTRSFLDLRGVTVTGEALTYSGGANNNSAGFGASTGTNLWTGTVAINQTAIVPVFSGASLELSGVVSGSSTIEKLGAGTLILSNNNTATGGFLARGGVVELNYTTNNGSKLADGAALTLGSAARNLAVQGQGAWNSGVNAMSVEGATIRLVGNAAADEIVSSTTIDPGSSSIIRPSGTTVLRLNAITRNAGGTLDLGAASIANTDTNSTNGILGGWATVARTNWAFSVATGAADTAITALATYNNDAYASGNNTDVIAFTATGGAVTTNSVRFNQAAGGTLTLGGTLSLQSGGLLVTPNVAAATIITGGAIQNAANTAALEALIIHQHSASPLQIASVIQNNTAANAQALTVSGTGPVVLTGNNLQSGIITINTGSTVRVGNAGGAYGLTATSNGTIGGNGTVSTAVTGAILNNGSLIFDGAGAEVSLNGAINGNGTIELASTNTRTIILNNSGNGFYGNVAINGGILAYGTSVVNTGNNSGLAANGLGSNIGRTVIGADGRLEFRTLQTTNPQNLTPGVGQTSEFISVSEGGEIGIPASVVNGNYVAQANINLGGRIDLDNTTVGGALFDIAASNHLSSGGTIKGSNGFTKTGNGILAINGTNWIDGVPTLNGQIIVANGILFVGNNGRALGGVGVGNETIVQSGATLDLRDTDLNFGDDSTVAREILQIAGIGVNGTGALRNSTGTAVITNLDLAANARVGGNANTQVASYDTNTSPAVTATYPVINGGGFDLTKVGSGEFDLIETTINSLGKLVISEGELRAQTRIQFPFGTNVANAYPLGNPAGTPTPLANYPHTLFTTANTSGGIDLVYGGQTADPVSPLLMLPIVGARLDLFRQHGAHHTANITSFGAASGTGGSYLELNSDTLPKVYTFWDGNITLTGQASGANTFFNIEGGGAGTLVGNTVVGNLGPSGDQVVNPTSMLIVQGVISGTGGITKIGSRELRLTAANTFSGDLVIARGNNNNQPIDPVQNESYANGFSVSLYGQGTLANTSNVVLERRGILRVINHNLFDGTNVNGAGTTNVGANLANRINDTATINLRNGLLVFDSGSNDVTETLGTVRPETGDSFIVANLQNGSNKNTTLTVNNFARQAGSVLTFTSWDSTSTFGTTAPAGDDSFRIATMGTGLTMTGAGGATSSAIATGVLGGLAVLPIDDYTLWANGTASNQERNMLFFSSRDFMTLDSGYLRPLDDSEYYTNTTNMAGAAGQNLNLSLPHTSVLDNLSVNSLRFGNLNDNLNNTSGSFIVPGTRMVGWQQYANALTIDDDRTLTISSGMLLFANMGQGVNQDMQTYINGGTLNFGANEGVINNVNGWYRTSDGQMVSNAAYIRSTIAGTVAPGSVGITKSGLADVFFDGLNTYSGLTKVANGPLNLRNNMALGAGGTGNGVVIEGSGQLYHRAGINVGQNTAAQVNPSLANNGLNLNASREDILVNVLSFDNQIFARSVDSVNRHYGNITLDLVDSAAQTAQGALRLQPRLFLDANTTFILAGNMGGGNTAVSQDTYYVDSRGWSLDGSAGWLVLQGSVGDKLDGSGLAQAVTGPVTNKPTGTVVSATSGAATSASTSVTVANTLGLWVNMQITGTGIPAGTTVTHINPWTNTLTLSQASTIPAGSTLSSPSLVNENEVLRTWVGGSDHLNVEATQQWSAVGRIELQRGWLRYTGDAGTDFYNATTLGLINASEAGNNHVGIQIGGGVMKNDPGDSSLVGFLLTKSGQSLGVNNWTITTNANNNQGMTMIGGENESGTVRFGPTSATAAASQISLGRNTAIYANAGGTVDIFSRFTGGSISKIGRGTVNLFGNSLANFGSINAANAGFTIGNIQTAGGELVLDYTQVNNNRANGDNAVNFNGGVMRLVGNAAANTSQNFTNVNDGQMRVRIGGSELVVQSITSRTTTLNLGRLASATDGAILSRDTGGTMNFVEFNNGGTAVITLSAKTGVTSNASIPWATYGTAPRTATDFAMVDTTGANVNAFGRALDEFNNDVATWNASGDISENGGSGYRNALAGNLTVNSLRFDAAADSIVSLGSNTLTVSGPTFNSFVGGGILVSSNVGTANKTITGGVLTTANTGELVIHHYGQGNLTIASQIGAAGAAPGRVIITGPAMTGAAQLNNWSSSTTGQVILTGANQTAAVETRWLLNGGVLSIDAENRLGNPTFAAATADAVYMNGGVLRWTGSTYTALDANRGFTIGGNGGVIDVVDGNGNLQITSDIVSENWLNNMQTGAANQYIGGDLIKMGAGTLTLTGGTDANQGGFTGMLDVREGTLRINGNNAATSGTSTISILGDNRTNILDGTIFRANTNFEVFLGASGGGITWNIEENIRFEGNNLIRFGIPGATNRTVGLNGVIDLAGDITVDVVPGLTARFNNGNGGYMTGSGDLTKIGEGAFDLRENNVMWTGGINVFAGTLRLASQGLPGGSGTQNLVLGSTTHQGLANLELYQETGIVQGRVDLFQDIDVTYNPLQGKRLAARLENGAGAEAWVHGDITMSDNLGLFVIQSGRYQGGTYGSLVINGNIKDDSVNSRSGNLVVHVDDESSGTANQQQIGEGTGYVVLRGNNSAWTGDLEIGLNQSYDQDEMAVVRLENTNALTNKNDVLMRGSSALQIAGNNITIGSLITNNAALNGTSTAGTANDGTGNFIGTTGSSAFIENASTTAASLTITQSTPANTQALWDVHFRDGQLPSHVLDNQNKASAALSIVKAGDGWATLSVDNHHTGTTTVTGGTLQVGRNGIGDTGATTAAGFTSNVGTTVAGTGQIHGSTIINGNLRPGDEAGSVMGTLTFTAATELAATSVTTLQVQRATYTAFNAVGYNDPAFGSFAASLTTDPTYSHMLNDPVTTAQHDKVVVNGALTVTNGGTKITLVNNGYTPTHGDVFNLLDWTTISGSFTVGGTPDGNGNGFFRTGAETGLDLTLFELGGGFRWDVSLFNTAGIVVVVVPEPSRALFLMLGLMGLMMRRRRKAI
ncbi:MAG: autotransporter-associated beta strand repeat-containing protein [Verrucomicrobiaceae bacterium]